MHKRTLYAVFVFIVLGFAAAWVLRASPERGITRLDLRQTATERVDAIEIVQQGKSTRLSRQDSGWALGEDDHADPDAVAALLAEVRRISTSDHITNDEGRFGELGLDNQNSTQVTLFAQSAPLARFFVNDASAQDSAASGRQLIRYEGQVFRLAGINTATFTRDPNSWEDRAVTHDVIESVSSVSFKPAKGDGYTLNQVEGAWDLKQGTLRPKNFRFDANLARFYVNGLLHLHTQEVIKQDLDVNVTKLDPQQADQISWQLQANSKDMFGGGERTLLLGAPKDEQTVYAQVVGQSRILLINRPQAEALKLPLTQFRALNMMDGPSFDDVVAATIHTTDKQVLSFARDSEGLWALDAKVVAPKGFELDQNKLRARLRQALLARAVAVVEDGLAVQKQVKPTFGQVTFTTSDKKTHALTFGPQTKEKSNETFFAWGTADSQTYLASKALRDSLLGGFATLSSQGPASTSRPSPQNLDSLPPELRRQIQKQLAKP